jgi:hypothetical protein
VIFPKLLHASIVAFPIVSINFTNILIPYLNKIVKKEV